MSLFSDNFWVIFASVLFTLPSFFATAQDGEYRADERIAVQPSRDAGPLELQQAIRSQAVTAWAVGQRRTGPKGIDVPSPPPGATIPESPNGPMVTLTVRTRDGSVHRMTGRQVLALTIDGGQAQAGAAIDLDVTARPFEHTHRVSGSWRSAYPVRLLINADESPMWPWKAAFTETTQNRNIARAVVVLTDECGHYIRKTTDAYGAFSFDWTPVDCGMGEITVYSVSDEAPTVGVGRWNNGPIAVASALTDQTADYRAYAFSVNFDTDEAEGSLSLGTLTVPSGHDAARGFRIMHNVQDALAYYDALPGIHRLELPKINVEHTEGLRPNDVACDEGGWGSLLGSAFYSAGIDPGFIHIPWDCNDLGFDAFAHIHETAHYFHRHFLRQDPLYGRFGEGMANAQAALITGLTWISTRGSGLLENMDVNSRMACWTGSSWEDRIDTFNQHADCLANGGTPGFPQAVVWDDTLASAGWFQRVVIDLTDGSGGEVQTEFAVPGQAPTGCGASCSFGQFDQIGSSEADLNDVLIHYLGGDLALGQNPNYIDRGLDGLDLTDLLDGMICRGHADPEDLTDVVVDAMGLEYDPSGAPETCPHPAD